MLQALLIFLVLVKEHSSRCGLCSYGDNMDHMRNYVLEQINLFVLGEIEIGVFVLFLTF
jgi:hypothetical protein